MIEDLSVRIFMQLVYNYKKTNFSCIICKMDPVQVIVMDVASTEKLNGKLKLQLKNGNRKY